MVIKTDIESFKKDAQKTRALKLKRYRSRIYNCMKIAQPSFFLLPFIFSVNVLAEQDGDQHIDPSKSMENIVSKKLSEKFRRDNVTEVTLDSPHNGRNGEGEDFDTSGKRPNLCPVTESRGEGHWPIKESVFSKSNSETAILRLSKLILESDEDGNYFARNYAVSWSEAMANEMMIIKGFALRRMAETNYSEREINVFCDFLINEAHNSH